MERLLMTTYTNAEGQIARPPKAAVIDGRWVDLRDADTATMVRAGFYPLTTEPVPDGYVATDWTITVAKGQATRTPTLAPAPEPGPPPRDLAVEVAALTAVIYAKTTITETDLAMARLNLADAETLAVESATKT
jgi:hypothetical protein